MSNCSHNCGSCGESSCQDRQAPAKPQLNAMSSVKKVVGVVSGKGGVGKSLITGLLASKIQSKNMRAAVLDADITGPSIPKLFGVSSHITGTELGLNPAVSSTGIELMSMNLLLDHPTDPVVWRGPIVGNVVQQFWTETIWHNIDIMFVDMPPGTGDVPLTVYQSLPIDGIVIVTSPQELVSMIVEKAVNMAKLDGVNIPILGIVENMSYFECPNCLTKHFIFGESHLEEIAGQHGISQIARIPIDKKIAAQCDLGQIEKIESVWLENLVQDIIALPCKEKK